jgi:acetyltransferase-like isoleucine patch superfamily enzyme
VSCPFGACDIVALGTPIIINGGDEGLFTFELALRSDDWTISGHIRDSGGDPIRGNVIVYNQIGQYVGDWWVDGDGYFETRQLPDGTYFAATRFTGGSFDEVWDNVSCINRTCDPTTATPIVVSGGNVSGIDFFLDPISGGGHIEGVLMDEFGAPVAHAGVEVFNNQGTHLFGFPTDGAGMFRTHLLANDNYYVRTTNEPGGLARELWVATEDLGNPDLNVLCPVPYWDCDNPGFITGNGATVNINNGDTGGVDFVLRVPPGGQITGHIFDQILWDQEMVDFPLIEVELALLFDRHGDNNWDHIANLQPDRDGNYTFAGLDDGDYKLFTQWIRWSDFYNPECYGGQYCDWGTNFSDPDTGDVITISGGSIFDPADLGLDFMGDRIVGTVTRSDTGGPVSNHDAYFRVNFFDEVGNRTDEADTNAIGQYFRPVGPNTYMLSTSHDTQAHNLINKAWTAGGGVPCFDDCTPHIAGGDVINFGGGTFLADFVLDPATIISGNVTAAIGGAPIANIQICSSRQSDGQWTGCSWSDQNGDYEIRGLEPRGDYEVFTNNLSGQNFQGASWPGLVDTTSGIAENINFVLDPAFAISGTLTDAATMNFVDNQLVCIGVQSTGDVVTCTRSDINGDYYAAGLQPGSDYIAFVLGRDTPYRSTMYDGADCPWNWCDFSLGNTLEVGNPGDATGIDFALPANTILSGTIFRDDGGGPVPHDWARARLYRASDGEIVTTANTNSDGEWYFGSMIADDYYVVLTPRFGNHVDEVYDDVPCPRLSCDLNQPGVQIITIANGQVIGGINATLVQGSRLSGWLTADGGPLAFGSVFIYTPAGAYAGFGSADENGYWESGSGLPLGDYYVSTRWDGNPPSNSEYFNMVWPNQPCGDPCDLTLGDLINVNGADDVSDINFDLISHGGGSQVLIAGRVTDDMGSPLNVWVEILDASGNFVDIRRTDAGGYWAIPVDTGQDYFARTTPWSTGNYIPEVWDDVACANCDVVTAGTPIQVGSENVPGIDFVLELGNSISGTLTDAVTMNPVDNQLVCIGRQGSSSGVTCVGSGSDGSYSKGGLEPGADYIAFVLGRDTPYRSTMWEGVDCPWNWCEFALGTTIAVGPGPGDATGIDFALQANTVLSGTISHDPGGGLIPHDFARARLYRASDGVLVATDNTDGNGLWYFGSMIPDDYYVVSTPRFGNEVDEVYDDVPCPRLTCNLGQPGVQVITIANGQVIGGIDATLVPGSRLSGWLTADGGTLAFVSVFIYTPAGAVAGFGSADENGYWESGSGLPAGDYYVSSRSIFNPDINQEYFSLVWPNRPCGDPCDLTQGDLITVNGTDDVSDINFDLYSHGGGAQALIAGRVTDNMGSPLPGVHIDIYDASGNFVDGRDADATGFWSVPVAANQDYLAVTADWSTGDYIPEVWDDVPCNWCDVAAVGTPISVGTDPVLGVDFELVTGNTLSGFVTDEVNGAPLQGVSVCAARLDVFRWVACGDTDVSGYYELAGLEPRDDIVPFIWQLGGQLYVPEVFDNRLCCQWWNGDPVTALLAGDAMADFALARSSTLSGTITDSVSMLGIAGAQVGLHDEQCFQVATAQTDVNGEFTISGFVGGIYRLAADASSIGYIRELYPDVKTYNPCGDDFAESTPIAIADEEQLAGADMDLDIGGIISGVISGPSGPLGRNQGQARMYAPDGDQLLVVNNWEPDDSYLLGGLLPGTFHVVLSSRNQGLVDEVYNNVPCPRFSCGPGPAESIVVGPGDIVPNIDATLDPGSLISGHLSDAATLAPLQFYSVAIYTETGIYASFGLSDENGDWYSRTALPAGNYIVSNQFRIVDRFDPVNGGYLPMVWPNLTCGEPCDFLLGTLVTVDGTPAGSVDGIDFAMELGASITGSVVSGGSTLAGVSVQLLSSADGSLIRAVTTDAAGLYSIDGVGSGDYFLRTSNMLGYEDQLHSGISCNPFCDPLSGTAVTVLPTDTVVGPFAFNLLTTPTISGVVRDDGGSAVGGVDVIAYDALGTPVASDTTDAAGEYTIANLYAGDFFVASDNSAGYVDALYDGDVCLPGCDPTLGTEITVTAGAAVSGIDLELGSASEISGNVHDGTSAIAGVTVEVYRDTGAFVASAISGGGGNYSIGGLAMGNYHVVTRNSFGYVDEGAGGGVCQSTCPPTSTATVTVPLNTTVDQDFQLDLGGQITGSVTDTVPNPLQSVTIKAYNEAGVLISSSTTGPEGTYTIDGLADGNVYLRTDNSLGYLNQRYDGLDCDALCDVLAGMPVAVSVNTTVPGIDFSLPLGGSIAGTILNASAVGIGGVQVQVFNAAGLLAGFAVTAGNGSYTVNGLEDGNYRVRTVNSSGYVDLVRGGDNCSPEPCDLFGGTETTVASSDETGVDATLQLGDQISGVATDGMGVPLPSGTAQVYSASGQLVKEGGIFSGSFLVNGLANGTYHMLVLNGSGLVDQLWQSLPCPGGSCDVTTGEAIVLSGAATQGIFSPLASGSRGGNKMLSNHIGPRLNFELERGTRLSGSVTNASGDAVKFANVYFFNSAGVLAGQTTTDGLGNFISSSSFPNGTYFVATSAPGMGGVGNGLIDEIYDDVPCAGECDPAVQAGTSVVISGGAANPIHFVLGAGKSISGQVTVSESGLPLSVATVELFKADGSLAGSKVTDGLGNYRFEGLLPGNYFALASHPSGAYSSVLYNGIDCTNGCDVTTGDVIAMAGMDIAMIDFALSDGSCPYQPGPGYPDSDGDGIVDECEQNPPVVHPGANVHESVLVGDGTVIDSDVDFGMGGSIGRFGWLKRYVQIKEDVTIGDNFLANRKVTIEKNVEIGDDVSLGRECKVEEDVQIGSRVSIGQRCEIKKFAMIEDDVSTGRDVIIEELALIGAGAQLGSEVKVGKQSIVMPGSVVPAGTEIGDGEVWPPE